MNIFHIYLIIINIAAFFIFGLDKKKAKANARRIPEKVLLWLCALGGAYGGFIGMFVFHHKTKKANFKYPIPLMGIAWAILIFALSGF